jgi:ubiquinone/menaquinone biosynthesis C-methylase UbiE
MMTQKELVKYYEQLHAEEDPYNVHLWPHLILLHNYRRQMVEELVSKYNIAPKFCLDIGAGDAEVVIGVSNLRGEKIISDISFNAMKRNRSINPNVNFIVCSANYLPFKKEKFDFVFCGEILEHLDDPLKVLERIFYAMREEGYFLITIPNEKNRVLCEEHITNFSLSNAQYLFSKYFEIIEAKGLYLDIIDLGFLDSKPYRNRVIELLLKLGESHVSESLGFIFLLKKKKSYNQAKYYTTKLIMASIDPDRYLDDEWYILEDWDYMKIRWTGKTASFYITAKNYIRIKYYSFVKNSITINIDDNITAKNRIMKGANEIMIDTSKYKNKVIKVTLEVKKKFIPDKTIKNGDTRKLGIAISEIEAFDC